MMHKFIFKIGQCLRNPSLQKKYQFLKNSESWTLEQLHDYQLKQLKELVLFSYENTRFYRKQWEALGIKPSDIRTLEDIKKLPTICKKDLLDNNKNIQSEYTFKKTFKASTSGTSGESLVFLREEPADSFNRASIFRGYSWYNVKPWERNLYFWGFNFSFFSKLKVRFLDSLQNRVRFFDYSNAGIQKSLQIIQKSSYVHGYSSMIYEVAKVVNKTNQPIPHQLKMIKGTSEKIFPAYKDEIRKAFGLSIINEYGAAETGIIAFECPQGNMHLNMEGVLVEEIDNEIVVTNLQQFSFPIIRYKLGDYISLDKKGEECTCGLKHSILNEVTGRIGKVVYGFQETYPSLYFYYIFKNMESKFNVKLNYQVIQHEKGTLNVAVEQLLKNETMAQLLDEFKVYFKNDMEIVIATNSEKKIAQKKQQSFISTL